MSHRPTSKLEPGGRRVRPIVQASSAVRPLRASTTFESGRAVCTRPRDHRRNCRERTAGGEQVNQETQELNLGRRAGGQEAAQVGRVGAGQEVVQELTAQEQPLTAEPGHEERGDERQASDQRQDARQ